MSYFISHYTVITIHSCCRCDCSQWKNIIIILVAFYIFILIISLASYRGHFTVFLREFYKKKRQKKLNHCCHTEKSEKTLLGTCWLLCRISGASKLSMQHVSLRLISRLMNNLVLKYNVIKHLSTLTKNLSTSAVIFLFTSYVILKVSSSPVSRLNCLPSLSITDLVHLCLVHLCTQARPALSSFRLSLHL